MFLGRGIAIRALNSAKQCWHLAFLEAAEQQKRQREINWKMASRTTQLNASDATKQNNVQQKSNHLHHWLTCSVG